MVIVVVPLVIIAAAELDERLRQRESPLRRAVDILRNWMLPGVCGVGRLRCRSSASITIHSSPTVAASFLLVSTTAVVLVVLKLVVGGIGEQSSGRRATCPTAPTCGPTNSCSPHRRMGSCRVCVGCGPVLSACGIGRDVAHHLICSPRHIERSCVGHVVAQRSPISNRRLD